MLGATYQLDEILYESTNSLVRRGVNQKTQQSVIVKILNHPYPSPEAIARFRREYRLTKALASTGVIDAYDLAMQQNSPAIVLEDFGAQALIAYMQGQTLSLETILNIAIQVTEALGAIHAQQIIHKDLNPSNIVINPDTQQVKLIDFGISIRLSQENPIADSPHALEGTLAYMSPEQTGRMNRVVDYRTDFYALGVTLYQLLTGELPFPTDDPMALIHSHIAKAPPPPHHLKAEIPATVSAIVLKLMAKTAEGRYQSAYGLKTDLETCLVHWQATGQVPEFVLGQDDVADRFQLPQKLYGRESEIKQLMMAFNRASQGQAELMLVHGHSGIGKSALINEIHKPIVRQRGYFIAGKYDQFQQNVPYQALVVAFRDLIRQILSETEAEIARWRERILSALGANAALIVTGIPELELIIGAQPPPPDLGATETQNRFNLVIRNFVRVFTQQAHPLVVFLDDLQWADLPSLQVIDLFLSDATQQHLLIIGAYRDNDMAAGHPLNLTLSNLTQAGTIIHDITLMPLALPHITQFVADAFHCFLEHAQPLAKLVQAKTGGNPFFVNEFLKTLYQEGLVHFNFEQGYWAWDLVQIDRVQITDNVVALMMQNLQRLPDETQALVTLAACLGNHFDLATLTLINQTVATATAEQLWPALQAGLVLPIGHRYKFFIDDVLGIDPHTIEYRFPHDRVQQAAYYLIPESDREQTHLMMGRLLSNQLSADAADERLIFDVVNQYNQGFAAIVDPAERKTLAELNLVAAQRAKASTAYQPSLQYLKTAIDLITDEGWQQHYDLTLAIYIEATEAAYLSTDFGQMTHFATLVLRHSRDPFDQIRIYETQIQYHFSQNQMQEAMVVAGQGLSLLGVAMPQKPNQLHLLWGLVKARYLRGTRSIEALQHLPLMTDTRQLAIMRLLNRAISAAYFADPALFAWLMVTQVNRTIKYGLSAYAAPAFAVYGAILCNPLGQIEAGYRFCQMALKLLEAWGSQEEKAKVFLAAGYLTVFWKDHLQTTIQLLQENYQHGLEAGSFEYAAGGPYVAGYHTFFIGQPLAKTHQLMTDWQPVLESLKQTRISVANAHNRQMIINLIEPSDTPHELVGDAFDEREVLPQFVAKGDRNGFTAIYAIKALLAYLFGYYAEAVSYAKIVQANIDTLLGAYFQAIHYFYYSLALLAVYPQAGWLAQTHLLATVAANQRKMKRWAKHAPMNFRHKYLLVEAERARIRGQTLKMMRRYDEALDLAQQHGYLSEEALIYEVAGRAYLHIHKPRIAQAYLREARYAYLRWGALAKVKALEEAFPHLRQANLSTPGLSTRIGTTTLNTGTATSSDHRQASSLDLMTVMKASQAISGEILLNKLLDRLMKIVLQSAGAQRAFLILDQDETMIIEAVCEIAENATSDSDYVTFLPHTPLADSDALSVPVVNYVYRTHETVVLHDAPNDDQFGHTAYIETRRPQSVLCLPLLNQGYLNGILYLEHNLMTHVFTAERTELLHLLSSQAAISIENARLYTDLEYLVEERTSELQTLYYRLQNDLLAAREIQRSLLPPPDPNWPTIDLLCYTMQAREVGGDFYAYHQFDDGSVGLAVGDVSNKGMGAALLMALSLASLQAALHPALSPPALFVQLDETLTPYARSTRQNCALCYVEVRRGQLWAVNAGCISPIIRRANGVVAWVDVGGMPLGIGLGAQTGYVEVCVELNPNDLVILTSDGIVEANNARGDIFGFERLEAAVATGPSTTAEAMLAHLRQAVAAFVGEAEPHDDATIVVLRV